MWSSKRHICARAAYSRVSVLRCHHITARITCCHDLDIEHPQGGFHVIQLRKSSSKSPKAINLTKVSNRRASTKVSFDLADLPQGLLSLEPAISPTQDELPAYPAVVLQARSNMRKFENCVLLTRVGGFYELYFEHAEEFGPLLNLKVAQKRTNAGPVSMVHLPPPKTVHVF